MLIRRHAQIGILAAAHFTADFYFGLCIPLPEPTLMRHLSVDLLAVMAIISTSAMVIDAIQPVGGALLPKKGAPLLLAVTPLLAAATSCIGLTARYWAVAALLLTAACGIGLLHNEAVLTVQGLTRRRHGLAVSVFMSGGYFGAATGGLVGGWWAQHFELRHFWVMGAPGLVLAGLVLLSGLHRVRPEGVEGAVTQEQGSVRFGVVFALAVSVATANVIIMRLMPVYIVRAFGDEAQVWGGAAFFAIGIAGAFGSYAWGYLAGRHRCGTLIAVAWFAGSPFLYLLFHPSTAAMVVVWGPLVGFTIGGVFPLTVVLARSARGWTQRLRLGFVIGGAWGLGEVGVLLISKYIDRFDPGALEPVSAGLNVCWVLLCCTAVLGGLTALAERRTSGGSGSLTRPLSGGEA